MTRAQSNTCPVFGTDQSSSLSRSREERVFLNFEAPSQCRGNLTSWGYCHYDSQVDDDDDEEYAAKFIIYRRSSLTSDIYIPVSGSITTTVLSHNAVSRFRCRDETLTQTFEIWENDVIGACIMDKGNINPLYLIGDTNNDNANQRLYQFDRGGYDDCMPSQINSIDTSNSDFVQRSEWNLHLYANIGM